MICLYLKIPGNFVCFILLGGFWVLCIYHLFVWSNLNFLHSSLSIIFSTQLCQVLYSFCCNLQHLHIVWLIVSSRSPHNFHLLFSCVSLIFPLTYLVLMALFCAAIRRDLVAFLMFPFFSHAQVFTSEISLVCHLKYPYSCFSCNFVFLVIVLLILVFD